MKKTFWPSFSRKIEYEKHHGTMYKGSQCILTVTGQFISSCLEDLLGRWKQFLKKIILSRWKTILVNFFSYYRVWQTSGNTLSGFTRYYGNRFASYKIISVTPNRLFKTQIFEKRLVFRRKSFFGLLSLVLSSRTDAMEQFLRVHNAVWLLLGKL